MSVNRSKIIGSYAARREELGPLPFMVEHLTPARKPSWFGHLLAVAAGLAIMYIIMRGMR